MSFLFLRPSARKSPEILKKNNTRMACRGCFFLEIMIHW